MTIEKAARDFFEACETGKGWSACATYCTANATFASQAEPLADTKTLKDYTEWMKGLLVPIPDGRYEIKSFALDREHQTVTVFAVFSGTHSGPSGPMVPSGKKVSSDYVYVMKFDKGKISHVTKIWNSGWALKQLGWV